MPAVMRALLVGTAAVATQAMATPRDHNPQEEGYVQGYHEFLNAPDSTKAFNIDGVDVSCTRDQLSTFVRSPNRWVPQGTCTDPEQYYAHTKNSLHFHELIFEDIIEDDFTPFFQNQQRLLINNLGGAGPNNGCDCGPNVRGGCPSYIENGRPEATFYSREQKLTDHLGSPAGFLGRFGLANSCPANPDAARIELARVTTIKCNGPFQPATYPGVSPNPAACESTPDGRFRANPLSGGAVNLRIYSTSVYRPGDFGVDENSFQTRSSQTADGNGKMFQINLRPAYNELAGPSYPVLGCTLTSSNVACPNYNIYDQPFLVQALLPVLTIPAFLNSLVRLLPDLGANLFDARYTNTVSLAFIFTLEDGTAYPLDEFYLSFFDFDQDYADGAYALVRETLIVYGFTTVFMDANTEVTSRFSNPALSSLPVVPTLPVVTVATDAQGLPVGSAYQRTTTFDPRVPNEDYELNAQTVNLPGAVFRSTREGTGNLELVKLAAQHCLGACSQGIQGPMGARYTGNTASMFTSICSANRQQPIAAVGPTGVASVGTIYDQQCLANAPCPVVNGGGSNPSQPIFQWTGCGFSDSFGLGSTTASGIGPDLTPDLSGARNDFYQSGASVACNLDCPRLRSLMAPPGDVRVDGGVLIGRNPATTPPNAGNCAYPNGGAPLRPQPDLFPGVDTSNCDDAGNPTDPERLTNQQLRRAVTFLFRQKSVVTIQFRTEFGSSALANSFNAMYDTGDNLNSPLQFPDTNQYDTTYASFPGANDGIARLNEQNSAFLNPLFRVQTGNPASQVEPPRLTPSPVRFLSNAGLISEASAFQALAVTQFSFPFCGLGVTTNCINAISETEQAGQFNPNKARVTLGTGTDPKGRNFLFGSKSGLVNACPPQCECYRYPGEGDTCLVNGLTFLQGNGVCNSPGPCPYGTDCTDCGIPPECPPECRLPPRPPLPYTPPPPPPPRPPVPMTTCTACLDPHLTFAHGGRADFRGKDKTWYPMLSARNVTFNTYFAHDDFVNKHKIVHGSAMKAAAWVLRTNTTGTIVTIEYNASAATRSSAQVKVADSATGVLVSHGSKAFVFENVRVEMRDRKLSGAGKNDFHGVALIVTDGRWQTSVWSRPYPNAAANPGKALLNIHMEALYDADLDPIAPHGLIGQSYDGDMMPTDGELDDYTAKEVTTKAMAEGALEGVASEYELRHKFATHFKYSRFDANAAKHRDVSKLRVAKDAKPRKEASAGTASADIEDDA